MSARGVRKSGWGAKVTEEDISVSNIFTSTKGMTFKGTNSVIFLPFPSTFIMTFDSFQLDPKLNHSITDIYKVFEETVPAFEKF
jgi:hypothetical protein